jgi:hypothetical protein
MNMESYCGIIFIEEIEYLGEKCARVSLCPPQIPYGFARAQTRNFEVRSRRFTTSAMARPQFLSTPYTFSIFGTEIPLECLTVLVSK